MTSVSTDRRQGVNSGAALKVPCRAASTGNLTLSGEQTIDGIACVTGDRVLVKNQTSGAQNGIYIVDTGTWGRAPDWDGAYDVVTGTAVYITSGSSNAGTYWAVTTTGTITVGTTSVAFTNAVISSAASISTIQSGTGAITRAVQAALRDFQLKPQDFGALGDGVTSDQAAWNLMVAAQLSSGKAIYLPAGNYVLTDTPSAFAGQMSMTGDGPFKSRIIFRPTAAGKSAVKLNNGAAKVGQCVFRGFSVYSDDTTYQKNAFECADISVCTFEDVYIWGTGGTDTPASGVAWSDTATKSSVGILVKGRELAMFDGIEVIADIPVRVSANPNTVRNDNEDCDHFTFRDIYLIANGPNYCITLDDGLGFSNLSFEGGLALVGGKGALKINDTRTGVGVIRSRNLSMHNLRHEQGNDVTQYAVNLQFTGGCESAQFVNFKFSSTTQGFNINYVEDLIFACAQPATLAGNTSLLAVCGNAASSLSWFGVKWPVSTTVTLTNYFLIFSGQYRTADTAAPERADYAGQIAGTSISVASGTVTAADTAVALTITGTSGDKQQWLPQAAGNGVLARTLNNGGTDYAQMSQTFSTLNFNHRTGTLTSASSGTIDSTGWKPAIRLQAKQGANVTAANNLTLGADGNYFQVDGATQINLVLNTNWQGGAEVTLKFNSNPTVKHNQAASGNNKPIILNGAVDFVAAANNMLTLRYDSTDAAWIEQGRKV